MYNTKNFHLVFLFLLSVVIVFSNIACSKGVDPEKKALKINNYTMTAGEFNEEFYDLSLSKDTSQSREAFLENLINRKIMLQEAQRLGLDKNKDFLRAVENFWEQSLLKIIIDKKVYEISQDISATDDEIKSRYNSWIAENPTEEKDLAELEDLIEWQILREKQTALLNTWLKNLKSKTSVKVDKKALGIE